MLTLLGGKATISTTDPFYVAPPNPYFAGIGFFIFLYVAYRLYMLPTHIGKRRGVDRLDTLRMFNMWAGWFPIGYACCLAYSVGGPTTAQVQAEYAYQRKIHRLLDNADTLFDEAVQRREPRMPHKQQAEPLAVDETLGDKTMAEKFI